MKNFQELVKEELERARQMFEPQHSHHESAAVIKEEYDEYWDWVKLNPSERDRIKMLRELVQIAAMAQRAAEDNGLIELGS